MLTFVVAFLVVCFDKSDSLTRLIVGLAFLVVIVLIAWCFFYGLSVITYTWFYGSLQLFITWKTIASKRGLMEKWDGIRNGLRTLRDLRWSRGNRQPVSAPNNDIGIDSFTV